MDRLCEGLVLSKKGFGEGHLILNFLDSEFGKIKLLAYGAALETGTRRATTLSGSFIEGLVVSQAKSSMNRITDSKLIHSLENIRSDLKSMSFIFYMLEILDNFLLEGDLFPYYEDLKEACLLFEEALDEKYILFFIAKFLGKESWLDIPEKNTLKEQTQRFLYDAYQQPMEFLRGKNISFPRKKELVYFYAYAFQHAKRKMPHSLELLTPHLV